MSWVNHFARRLNHSQDEYQPSSSPIAIRRLLIQIFEDFSQNSLPNINTLLAANIQTSERALTDITAAAVNTDSSKKTGRPPGLKGAKPRKKRVDPGKKGPNIYIFIACS